MQKIILLLFLFVVSPAARSSESLLDVLADRIKSVFGLPTAAYKVIGIADGDTLTVLKDQKPIKLRLGGIDAPEKKQAFGSRAKESLEQLCAGKYAAYQTQDTDRYGRIVARVTCNGIEANRVQVERGMAWVYLQYNKDAMLPPLEAAARAERRGLWSDPAPVAPWKWRENQRGKQ